MRSLLSIKPLLFISIVFLLIFLYAKVTKIKSNNDQRFNSRMDKMEKAIEKLITKLDKQQTLSSTKENPESQMKYILRWTSSKTIPFVYMGEGRNVFIERNCTFTNCYVTGNRSYLGEDYTKFDVIAFHGPEVIHRSKSFFPDKRSPHQKYAFGSIESSDNYPVCTNVLNGLFNWTWTYKTNSDSRWGYMAIRDSNKKLIGPDTVMHWMKLADMNPVSDEFKESLKSKTKAAAWFVSNCHSRSGREKFVRELQGHLKKYNLDVDIYGRCGPLKCPPDKHDDCVKMLETDYYFYLSFENSFAEDYVTEKLLYPLENNAVPIVFGGANYSRFMPEGIYINARELGAEKLAVKMHELISDLDQYAEYFKWKNHYSYHRRHESMETEDYCRFCSMLNEKDLVEKTTVYENFKEWWNPPNRC